MKVRLPHPEISINFTSKPYKLVFPSKPGWSRVPEKCVTFKKTDLYGDMFQI